MPETGTPEDWSNSFIRLTLFSLADLDYHRRRFHRYFEEEGQPLEREFQ
jgi:hypothetical protein